MTLKNIVTWIPQSSRFRKPLQSQRVHMVESVLKSARQHFHASFPLSQEILNQKTSLLVICGFLGMFGNTFTAAHIYFCHVISTKTLNFFCSFYCIFRIYIKFSAFWKEDQLHSLIISKVIDQEEYGYLNAQKLPF